MIVLRLRAVPVLVIGIVVVLAASVAAARARDDSRAPVTTRSLDAVGPVLPPQEEVPVAQVDGKATFTVYHPATSWANDSTVARAYVLSHGGGVNSDAELIYPLPGGMTAGVRLRYLVVSEHSWTFGEPNAFFNEDLAGNPDVGKSRCDFDSVPALCVQANSPSDATHENPAFVSLDIDGVSVELMGGNDLDALLAVAHSLTRGTLRARRGDAVSRYRCRKTDRSSNCSYSRGGVVEKPLTG